MAGWGFIVLSFCFCYNSFQFSFTFNDLQGEFAEQ